MSYKTTRQADQDIIDIYVHGAAEFGVDQAEYYHAARSLTRRCGCILTERTL